MDPQTAGALATSAATLVQLIALYRQQVGSRKDLTHKHFIEWLDYHRLESVKEQITQTFHLQSQVDGLRGCGRDRERR